MKYKVLIVDDEPTICKGIIELIDWESLGLKVIGSRENGIEALDIIEKEEPEIVITDIMMPEMNGLELIKRVHNQNLNVNFIVLSGYDEFEFASTAMKFGVQEYILKPCDDIEITESLKKVLEDIRQKEKKEQIFNRMTDNWKKALPQIKEKFLVEAIEMDSYLANTKSIKKMFEMTDSFYRLVLLRPEKECSLLGRFALKNISEELLALKKLQISAISNRDILLLFGSVEHAELEKPLEEIQQVFLQYYDKKTFIAISDEAPLEEIQSMYADIRECLQYGFYIGEGHLITKNEINLEKDTVNNSLDKYFQKIVVSVKTGHVEAVKLQMSNFFMHLSNTKQRIEITNMKCMELLINILQQSTSDDLDTYAQAIIELDKMDTLSQVEQYVTKLGIEITKSNYEYTVKKYSKAVEQVINYIEEQLANPELSLKKIAREILFMNEDYLGRLFQREMGERFSQYVYRLRMEKAKHLLEEKSNLKMFEISDITGFGNKSHYFSLAFKKYTGMSPTEYKNLFVVSKNNSY
ncbi:two-component system, response regulator YesN [Gracilibacillus orientalis]|uniref:Two-component system, response regulator YesN n=1 Tax=Gracilibacillus orientalis TaxID=334253 RepID=A0A1I4N7T9_9BACI|nr:response regulator [Gracilibacillus orientalis]SFM11548.1 two-component system, response regulator YesN [Gracilibacillus orientalis]